MLLLNAIAAIREAHSATKKSFIEAVSRPTNRLGAAQFEDVHANHAA